MTSNGRHRVVITGTGALTPLGNSVEEFWGAAVAGQSGIRHFQELDPSGYPCHVVGEVLDFEPTEDRASKSAQA